MQEQNLFRGVFCLETFVRRTTALIVILACLFSSLPLLSASAATSNAASANGPGHLRGTARGKFDSSIADWPEFHGDAARDSNQNSNTLLTNVNAQALVPLSGTAYTTSGSAEDSPAVYQGILYYVANTLLVNKYKTLHISVLYAVDTSLGQTIWSYRFPACGTATAPEFVASSPAVTTGLVNGVSTTEVYIGWGVKKGCFYDFNGQTGAIIWTYGPTPGILSSPAIMTTNADTLVVYGDEHDYVKAFSTTYNGTIGGSQLPSWVYDNRNDPPPTGYSQYCQPAPELCGDSVWSSPAEALVMVNGVPHHYAYFGVGAQTNTVGRLDAIDMDLLTNGSPTLAWAFWDPNPLFDDDFGTVSVLTDANGFGVRVYGGTNSGHEFGVDAVTGVMYFDFNTSAQLGGSVLSLIHSNGAIATINGITELIFASGCPDLKTCQGPFGYIWAIDALSTTTTGTMLWQSINLGAEVVSSPVVVNQDANAVVFVLGPWKMSAATHGDLLALDPTTGLILADYQVLSHAYGAISSPVVYGDHIFVTEGFDEYHNAKPGVGGLAAFQCAGCP